MKKILISAPIGGHKQYSINDWFNWIARQTYPNYDICLWCAIKNIKTYKHIQKSKYI